MMYILCATVQYIQISPPTRYTMCTFITRGSYMFQSYILAIFRELQVWLTCTVYMATSHRWLAGYIRIYKNTWIPKTPDQQHLKTQLLPFNTVNGYLNQLQIPTEVEPIYPTTVPTEYQSYHTNLSLLSEVKKHDTPTIALQKLAIATINERYPPEEYPRIYTDGSLSKIDGKAGAGIHSELFSHYISVGNNRTSFDGEITAIAIALQQLLLRPTAFKKAVLLVDSKYAIQMIASNK